MVQILVDLRNLKYCHIRIINNNQDSFKNYSMIKNIIFMKIKFNNIKGKNFNKYIIKKGFICFSSCSCLSINKKI